MRFTLKWLFVVPLLVGLLILALSPHRQGWFYWAIALRITLFFLAGLLLVLLTYGGRGARAFGIGAICPALVGVALAAHPLFHGPQGGSTQGLTVLALRALNDGSPLVDLQFSVGFLLALGITCGLATFGFSRLIEKRP
jgi:hypothetical protein